MDLNEFTDEDLFFNFLLKGKTIKKKSDEGLIDVEYPFQEFEDAEFFIVYMAAKWCETCVKFTPILKQLYDEVKSRGTEKVRILFISFDRTIEEMEEFMLESHGDWYGYYADPNEESDEETVIRDWNIRRMFECGGLPMIGFRRYHIWKFIKRLDDVLVHKYGSLEFWTKDTLDEMISIAHDLKKRKKGEDDEKEADESEKTGEDSGGKDSADKENIDTDETFDTLLENAGDIHSCCCSMYRYKEWEVVPLFDILTEYNPLRGMDGEILNEEEFKSFELVGFFFISEIGSLMELDRSVEHQHSFHEQVKEFYESVKEQDETFEIVSISMDRSSNDLTSDATKNYGDWLIVPYNYFTLGKICRKFGVIGHPQLFILNQSGEMVSDRGLEDIAEKGADALLAWKEGKPATEPKKRCYDADDA